MLLALFTLSLLILGSFLAGYGLFYRSLYKRLRYLALSECEFKETRGELFARHPLMKEERWERLTEAYSFATQPRNNLQNLAEEKRELLESSEQQSQKTLIEDEQYQPGQWKTKEDVFDE